MATGAERTDGMAAAAGMTLRDAFGSRRLSPEAALVLVHPIVDALAALHGAGIVHGGVCAEHVVVSPLGDVRLVRAERAASGQALHAAPEHADGRDVDASADVWSVGALLYELVAGRPPAGDALASVDRRVSPELDWVVGVCLARDPWKRPRDARALMDRLAPSIPCALDRLRAERVALLSDPDAWQRAFGAKAAARAIGDAERALASGDELGALRAVERVLAYRPEDPDALALAGRAADPSLTGAAPRVDPAPIAAAPAPRTLPGWTHGIASALGTGALLVLGVGAVMWMAVRDEDLPLVAARDERPRREEVLEPLRLELIPNDLPAMTYGLATGDGPILPLDDRGGHATALAAAEARLARDPSDRAARIDRAAALLALGHDDAWRALDSLGTAADALALRGLVALRRGRFEDADARLSEALAADGRHHRARLRRGVLRSRLGRARDAYRDLWQLVEARAAGVVAMAELARIESQAGHARHTAPLLRRVLRERPRSPDAHVDLALALGPSREALAAIERALALDPESARAHRARCVFLERTRGTGALAACNEAIARRPEDAELFASRASVRSLAGQHDEALADASRAIALAPGAPRFLYERSLVRRRASDDGGAFRDLSAACAMHDERSCQDLRARGVAPP